VEASIKIGGRGKFVDKEGAVDFLVFLNLFKGVPVISTRRADSQSHYRKQIAGAGKKRKLNAMPHSRQAKPPHRHSLTIQGYLASLMKAPGDFTIKAIQTLIENLPCFIAEFVFAVHSSMPFALSAAARV